MAAIAPAMPYIMGLTALAGSYMTFQQHRSMQEIAEYNAAVAEDSARVARFQAEQEARDERRRIERLLGTQTSLFSKSGVTLEGTPLLVMAETAAEGEREIRKILFSGEVQAGKYQSQAAGSEYAADQYGTAGWTMAGKGLLTGAERIGGLYIE